MSFIGYDVSEGKVLTADGGTKICQSCCTGTYASVWCLDNTTPPTVLWTYDTGTRVDKIARDSGGNIIAAQLKGGNSSLFEITKLNSSGVLQWAVDLYLDTERIQEVIALVCIGTDIYIMFDRIGSSVTFLAKLNSSGVLQWDISMIIGSTVFTYIDMKVANGYLICQYHDYTHKWGHYEGVSKYNTNGTRQWYKSIQSSYPQSVPPYKGIGIDSENNIFCFNHLLFLSPDITVSRLMKIIDGGTYGTIDHEWLQDDFDAITPVRFVYSLEVAMDSNDDLIVGCPIAGGPLYEVLWKFTFDPYPTITYAWHYGLERPPLGIIIDVDDNIYVAKTKHTVDPFLKFDSDGNLLTSFDVGTGLFCITIDPASNGDIYVGGWRLPL